MTKDLEKMMEKENPFMQLIEKKDSKKDLGIAFKNKLSLVEGGANVLDDIENNYTSEDDFEDIRIRIPHNDEFTSSSDDSEFEFYNYREHRKTLSSLAQAVRLEFLQNMPVQSKQRRQQSTSLMKTLNTYMSLPKSWQNETDSLSQRCSLPERDIEKADKIKFHHPVAEKEDVLHAINMISPSYEAIHEEPEQFERIEEKRQEKKEATPSQSFKKVTVQQAHFERTSKTMADPTNSEQDGRELFVAMATCDTPRNALVLYWGRMNMTAKELQSKNLSRSIKALLEDDHYEFVLLKIQERKLLLQYCSTSKKEAPEDKALKNKRKKSLTEAIRSSGRDLLKRQRDDDVQLLQDRRGSKSNIFACIGLTGSSSRSQTSLQHNDSLSLKSYQLMKRKRLLEFDYQKIVYCGVEERSIPNNMLVWIYHTEYGNYSAVECHCVECDDQSHARQLSRALKHEIAKIHGC